MSGAAAATPPRRRLDWPDIARGISILGVILLHVSLAVPGGMDTRAAEFNAVLDPLRMPLFFLVSGFFATKVLRFGFLELVTRRLWFFLVPYVIWVPVELFLKAKEYQAVFDRELPPLSHYVSHVVTGTNMAWFLYALVLFNVILWLTRRMPWWGALIVSLLPVLVLPLHDDFHIVGKAVLYLPIFMMGAHLRGPVGSFAATALTPSRLIFSGLTYLAGLGLLFGWNRLADSGAVISLPWPFGLADSVGAPELRLVVLLLVQSLMLAMAITVTVVIARVVWLAEPLKFFGRHTLVLYLGHPIALILGYHRLQYELQLTIARHAEHWLNDTAFWMAYAFAVCLAGGLVFWVITKTPVLKWSLTPPQLPHSTLTAPQPETLRDRQHEPSP
ncbi:Acyltransferase family protein [Corynebacterium guangdongense]|nr:Acyltransferase family protein [Corynebacterium guangdongense]